MIYHGDTEGREALRYPLVLGENDLLLRLETERGNSSMRWSQFFIPTLREDPADAEVVSHKLLLRAGIVRQLAAGIYSYLPLGQRIALKVMQILREEMNRIGGKEFYLPALHPAEIW